MKFRLLILVLFFISCQNESELATIEDVDFIIYNESVNCRPVAISESLFVVATNDSVPYLTKYDMSGEKTELYDISDYFVDNQTLDSLDRICLTHINNDNLIVSFTYNDSIDTASVVILKAIEFSQSGQVIDDLSVQISTSDSIQNYAYSAINKTESDEWLIVMSLQSNQLTQENTSKLYIKTLIINDSGESNSSIVEFDGYILDNAYSLTDNSIALVISENVENTTMETNEVSSITKLVILKSVNEYNEIEFSEDLSVVSVVKWIDDELFVLGTQIEDIEETKVVCFTYDSGLNLLNSITNSLNGYFIPTCIVLNEEQYIIGGYYGEEQEIDWTDIYSNKFVSSEMFALSSDSQVLWSNQKFPQFPEILLGLCNNQSELLWLYAKVSFSTYNNIALLKTDITGNI